MQVEDDHNTLWSSSDPSSQGRKRKFAKLDGAVIALHNDRPRLALVWIDSDRSQTVDFLVVYDVHSVQHDGDPVFNEL